MFDSFSYKYQKAGLNTVSNRLYHVNDDVSMTGIMSDDIDDEGVFTEENIQTANNYGYDEIGNLKFDKTEGIESIEWTAYGKVKSITRQANYYKTINDIDVYPSNLEFKYDAMGNRIAKIEKPRDATGQKSSADWKTTYYIRDAQGNPMATYKKSSETEAASFKLIEHPIYGSSRVGIDNYTVEFVGYTAPSSGLTSRVLGLKQYELTNHLGNVLTTISDKRIPVENNGVVDHYVADITTASDYYPFGSPMDGRTFSSEKYRFGFQGQEAENEISGIGNYSFFKYRISDNRLGRFFTVDPLADKYPYNSTYAFSENRVIDGVELEGLEYYRPSVQRYGYNNMLNNRPSYGTINRYSYTPPTQRIQQPVNNNYFTRYPTPGSSPHTDPQTSTGVSRVGYISLYLTDYLSNYTAEYNDKIINQSPYTDKVSDVEMTEKIYNQSGNITRQFQIKFYEPSDEIAFLKEQSDWVTKRNDAVSKIPKPQKPTDKSDASMKQYMNEMFIYKGRVMMTEFFLGLSPAEKLLKDVNNQRGKYKLVESSPIPTISVKY